MMYRSAIYLPISRRRLQGYRGFSFIEVMFAVIVLGIGFIMVSAMFPVAIQQTQSNVEDAAAGRIGQLAMTNFTALKQDLISKTTFNTTGKLNDAYYGWPMSVAQPTAIASQVTGKIFSFRDVRWANFANPPVTPQYPVPTITPAIRYEFSLFSSASTLLNPGGTTGLWERVRGNMISSAEPQFAYVPMFPAKLRCCISGIVFNQPPPAEAKVNIYCFIAAARNRTPYTYKLLPNALSSSASSYASLADIYRNPPSSGDTGDTRSTIPTLAPATLEPRLVSAIFHSHLNFPADVKADPIVDLIEIKASANGKIESPDAAGDGGFVIISYDDNPANTAATATFTPGMLNGASFRFGSRCGPVRPLMITSTNCSPDMTSQQSTGKLAECGARHHRRFYPRSPAPRSEQQLGHKHESLRRS